MPALMSTRLGNQFSVASTYLMISLVFSVFFAISVNALTQVKEDGDPEKDMVVPDDAMEAWFFWGRWIVIFTMMTFVYGCMQSINVLNDVYYLKWPQVWLEELCKDNGWTPVLDVNGSEVTFDTQAEIEAVQYEGGRFVAYTSSYSFTRIFDKELLIGNAHDGTRTYTSFENIDPLQQNGLGVFVFLGLTAVAVTMLGYAQACADANVKDYFVSKQKERDEAEIGQGSGGTSNGGGEADDTIVETEFEEVGTMLTGQQAAASSRAAPTIQLRTNKTRERPLSEAFGGFDDAGGEKHLAKKKEKKPKKQETAAQRHSVTSVGQPATSGLGTFVASSAESTTDLTASTPAPASSKAKISAAGSDSFGEW